MDLQALRQLALDTATALDAEADVQKWPEIVNGLLRQLLQVTGAKGFDAKAFYNQLELPEDEPNVVLFESTDAPDLIGLSEATVTELEAWSAAPGSGFLVGNYGRIECLPGQRWPLDAPDGGDAHSVLRTLIEEEFLYDEDATPVDELSIGDWGGVQPLPQHQWLVLCAEYREQAILAAPHLATEGRPLPLFWCDWMDEIGLTFLGGTAREGLRSLQRRGIEALVRETASVIGLPDHELRGLLAS